MTQLSLMIALLAALALGNATSSSLNPIPQSPAEDSISLDKAGKVEPPKEQAGVAEGGWPAF